WRMPVGAGTRSALGKRSPVQIVLKKRSRFLFLRRAIRFGDGPGTPIALVLLCFAGVLLFEASRSIELGPRRTSTLQVERSRISHENRNAYLISAVLPGPDSSSLPDYSTMELFESGRPLGPGHSYHEEIRQQGAGRYSHWNTGIYFSASDN